uniref:Neurotransmitter-gated ion-channel ligand-binding domain-containing protein n=1 Tax=Tetranychus urticae TaxID=32264 RepID=T1KYX4_TETUR
MNLNIGQNEKEQLLVSNIWLQMSWTDVNLTWNSSDYGGLTSLRIPSSRIWKPDLLLYNSADPRFDSTYPTNLVVQSNGSIFYLPPGVFTSTCKIDITWFPFDDQLCKLKFGSWSHDMSQVDLDVISNQGDLSTYIENGEWILLGILGRRNKVLYRCCADPFTDVTYTIHIRRRTLYYGINLIIPCLIISSMTLLGFTLPPDSGEKLTLGVTILLSMTVFLLQLTETLPATSDTVSAIATYFASIMLMVAFSVVMTVVVLNFHYKSSEVHELNPLMKKVILQWLAFILNVKRPGAVKPPDRSNRFTSKVYTINGDGIPIPLSPQNQCQNCFTVNNSSLPNLAYPRHPHQVCSCCRKSYPVNGDCLNEEESLMRNFHDKIDSLPGPTVSQSVLAQHQVSRQAKHCACHGKQLDDILNEIQYMTNRLRKEDQVIEILDDWKFAAIVIDRLCFVMFSTFSIISSSICFMSAPHLIV